VLAEILKRAHRNPFRALMKAGPAPNWKAILKIMPAEDMLEEPSLALFQRQWKLYRKVVDNNYIFHREAYAQLHRILVDEAVGPFRFLDIACGDARATAGALKETRVAHYPWDRSLSGSAKFGGQRSCNAALSNQARTRRFCRSAAGLVPARGCRVDRSFAPSPHDSREANPDAQDSQYGSRARSLSDL